MEGGQQAGRVRTDDFIKPYALEERIYRLRCVEMWSIVVPWIGIPLADIINAWTARRARSSSISPRCTTPSACRARSRSCGGRTSRAFAWTRR